MKTVSDAVKQFRGVFPKSFYGDDSCVTTPPNCIAQCIRAYAEDGALFESGLLYPVLSPDFSSEYFVVVCTKEEFEAEARRVTESSDVVQNTSASIANLLNAQGAISQARKSSEFSSNNAELADQADAILQAIIDNLKVDRIPAEASFHLANAQNELSACKSLLSGDKQLADAVFCLSEKLAGIRKGEL